MKKRAKKRFLKKYDGMKYAWFLMMRDFLLYLVVALVLFNLLIGISRVDGDSMNPTLKNGETVFFTRVNFGYRAGDVVFAKMPSGHYYVKRVLAMEGDVVDIRDGVLYVNDVAETGAYLQEPTFPTAGIVAYPYLVEAGMLFVVGDNRDGSEDSRSFGALPESSIRGKLLFVK